MKPPPTADYAELHCLSAFSFQHSASLPDELVQRARTLGYRALALTDECSVAGMARGLGSLAKFAGETVKARSGGLGSLVGAVSGEVERQLEKRAVEFVDASIAGVFGQIADALSDPKRAEEAAELRMAIFDGAL
jgi:hypothetical protein